MVAREGQDTYDKYLETEIIMYCLKECINSSRMSPAIKVKVLSLMYGCNNSFEESTSDSTIGRTTLRSENTTLCADSRHDINFLGIDQDILQEGSETLTLEEEVQLKECVLQEITKFYNFCKALDTEVKFPVNDCKMVALLNDVEEQVENQKLELDHLFDMQNKVRDTIIESGTNFIEMIEATISTAHNLKSTGSKLLARIDKLSQEGNRLYYLEKAERILEEKIARDETKIEQVKLELLDLNNEY